MTHRDRHHYSREWSPMWGNRRVRCTCGHDDPDEALWLLVSTLLELAAALCALLAAIVRRPVLAVVLALAAAIGLLVAAVVWGW
jgi:hypothetical protein